MKKSLLFAIFFASSLFCQDPAPQTLDVIAMAIDKNLDADLVTKAIKAKKPTAEKIQKYLDLANRRYEILKYQITDHELIGLTYPDVQTVKDSRNIIEKKRGSWSEVIQKSTGCMTLILTILFRIHEVTPLPDNIMLTFIIASFSIPIICPINYYFFNKRVNSYENSLDIIEFLENYKPEEGQSA